VSKPTRGVPSELEPGCRALPTPHPQINALGLKAAPNTTEAHGGLVENSCLVLGLLCTQSSFKEYILAANSTQ
jgi:hypothetical protein